jgi:hypothetical protein
LLGVGLWAQTGKEAHHAPVIVRGGGFGDVISGENIGFRRSYNPSEKPGTVTGGLVVRINGEWLVATSPVSLAPVQR